MGNSIRLLLAIFVFDLKQESSFAETFLSKTFFADFSKKKIQLIKMVVKSNFIQKKKLNCGIFLEIR